MFDLPKHTIVDKSIPKNAFDKYINTQQKKLFSEYIDKIRWTNKLSTSTINLPTNEIEEIQIFNISLKKKGDISSLLEIIDRSIPYHVIFVINFNEEILLSVAKKHSHPNNENNSIIDWVFQSDWIMSNEFSYKLNLKESIDMIFSDICNQLSGNNNKSINELVESNLEKESLDKKIQKLKIQLKNCKQFNKKVELNLQLDKMNNIYKKLI